MSDAQSGPWSRGQDWVNLAAGGYLALAPLWVETTRGAAWAMVAVGLTIVGLALVALARPGAFVDEWAAALGGAVAVAAPWLFGFTSSSAAAWTSWIVGLVVTTSALTALPATRGKARAGTRATHHPGRHLT
ncbi:MAG TPA: SPW repeat protein [Nocardioidaceae bacterium]